MCIRDSVGSDGQQGEGRTGILVNREFLQFFAEEIYEVNAKAVSYTHLTRPSVCHSSAYEASGAGYK